MMLQNKQVGVRARRQDLRNQTRPLMKFLLLKSTFSDGFKLVASTQKSVKKKEDHFSL
jgi:hypothetical protein